jgi:competence protein ComEC
MELNKKNIIKVFFLLLLTLPFLLFVSWPSSKLEFIACDVGQGDAILIQKGYTQVLVDGGPDNKVLECLTENMPFWDRKIEMIVNTHPEKDHFTGLLEVVSRYKVDGFLTTNLYNPSSGFKAFYNKVKEEDILVFTPFKGNKIKLEDFEFQVLWPEKNSLQAGIWDKEVDKKVLGEFTAKEINFNDFSLVLHLRYKDFDAVLTGDIGIAQEKKIIKEFDFSDIEVLKIAHHGSKYSSSKEFLQAVDPKVAVICVGKNPWGHPRQEVLDLLKSLGIKTLRTDKDEVRLVY